MSRLSAKCVLINAVAKVALDEIDFIEETMGLRGDAQIDEVLDNYHEDMNAILLAHRGNHFHIPKSIDWRQNVLSSFDDKQFVEMLRVTPQQFQLIVNLVQPHTNFINRGARLQIPVDLQVAIVLFRLGSSGNSGSVKKIATLFGIGDGGTLAKITSRVFDAILDKMKQFLYWPDEEEREKIASYTMKELPHCIGYIDATEIKLSEKPRYNHESYFSRQGNYAIKLQAICDYKLRIRDVVVGYPGSWHDSKIYKSGIICKRSSKYFSGEQWMAGDSAYPLSKYLIVPYRSNSHFMDAEKRKRFNKRHSRYRVRIENCIVLLKNKFRSLKDMRIRIGNLASKKFFCKWVTVCCILHNILLTDEEVENMQPESEEDDDCYQDTFFNAISNEEKRKAMCNLMFNE